MVAEKEMPLAATHVQCVAEKDRVREKPWGDACVDALHSARDDRFRWESTQEKRRMSRAVIVSALSLLLVVASSFAAKAADVEVGKPAPNFKAPAADGSTFELAGLKGEKAVVLVFSRGHWCPFCNRHMRELQKSYPQFKEAGAELVVVFREDNVAGVKKAVAQAKAGFPMLVDQGKKQTMAYSPQGYDVYVVAKDGNVAAVLEGTKPKRPGAAAILAELEKLGSE